MSDAQPLSEYEWMHRALELAERGRGFVEPNPLVGAVVVRDGQIVGEGWHQRYGEAHAEIHALAAAGEAAREATLYVTLEPCCHHGKTPPCTEAILRAGIRRVVAAMPDPFPAVAGKGAEQLRQAGVTVEFGIGEAEARRLNAPYLKLLTTGRPWVHAKWAMTLDGKIATRSGDSRWISNEASRRRVHELRGRMDAIVAGIGTVLADNPQLTARPPGSRTPTRIVLDSQGRIHDDSILIQTARTTPTLVAATDRLPDAKCAALQAHGCEVLRLPSVERQASVAALLAELGRRRFTNVLVEGGSGVFGSFLDAAAIDEFHVFIAPRLVGGAAATPAVGGHGVERMAEALRLVEWRHEVLDGDLYVTGLTQRPPT
ncbi:MAG TPA: bifunctional diaminohydroxyphosphoribosylaminopyrimidine deaminase/5-amino-6-(5-phosphoribosylamino)uracil reductase RibD [Gemmataceae bacterium]|nr:bifunctional diaminohydroxyphosphoribosylaminopyrimidine deaminase/5-amino-6-(5-phosphoribosylamino)uracil reductase RibD [Gemmataceae bacterium]